MRLMIYFSGIAMLFLSAISVSATVWGERYFPNVPLTTQSGDTVRFFDDLIEGKIVVLNFIYTTCPDTCPLETAQLVKVQEILGDRLGDDVFFYSITIDPDNDTPEVLREYKEQFGARWTFLTGKADDIDGLRRKLGLFIPEIPDDSNNHNVNMIIGNQTTGRWMKRSPFENPYVLADQIGNWLDGWKHPPQLESYLNAPKLRDLPRGEQIFRTRCASCHTITGKEMPGALGPDLLGVTRVRERRWLLDWLRAPDQMLRDQDPIAISLFEKYNKLAMPNLRLNQEEGSDVLDYLEIETRYVLGERGAASLALVSNEAPETRQVAFDVERTSENDVVALMNAWVREARPGGRTNAGYLTLVNVGSADLALTGVQSKAFERVEIHEMTRVDGLTRMRALKELVIPAGGQVQLKPGGKHLMLINASERLSTGQVVELTLEFGSGAQQVVRMGVAKR